MQFSLLFLSRLCAMRHLCTDPSVFPLFFLSRLGIYDDIYITWRFALCQGVAHATPIVIGWVYISQRSWRKRGLKSAFYRWVNPFIKWFSKLRWLIAPFISSFSFFLFPFSLQLHHSSLTVALYWHCMRCLDTYTYWWAHEF